MIGWNRVCCAVDFSEPSRLAMLEAARLARRFGAELTLVHVDEVPLRVETDMLVVPGDLGVDRARRLAETLEVWRNEAAHVAERPTRAALLAGAPAHEIVRHARELRADLVVVGTHGRKGVERFFLGSVAERVVREAQCPVLVVRPIEA